MGKTIFTADIGDFIKRPETSEEPEHIEEMIRFGDRLALNIRAVFVQKDGAVRPNCWLHTINEDGTTEPFIFFPIVASQFSRFNGGHNETAFKKIFGEVWNRLEAQMTERMRNDGSRQAVPTGATSNTTEEVPF